MQDRVAQNPGRVLITPEDGSAPFYATVTRADNPTVEGTKINKNALLKDTTAALYGLGTDAVPDEVLALIKSVIDENYEELSAVIATAPKIATGTYTGNGKVGSSNKNSLTFDFVPKLVLIFTGDSDTVYHGIFINGVARVLVRHNSGAGSYACYVTWSDKKLTWYYPNTSEAYYQLNQSSTKYYYVAIGV